MKLHRSLLVRPEPATIPAMYQPNLAGKRVVVMGLGRFGGGIGVTRWLVEQQAEVVVTDLAPAEALAESLAQIADLPLTLRLGGHDPADLEACDLLVVSSAVPKQGSEFVGRALALGIPITSEINLFVERCPARRVVGVTGSAGKSTTTAMIGAVLQAASDAGCLDRVWVGGNIGRSLLSDLANMTAADVVVLELSSFQLEDLGAAKWSPSLAVITNIRPNHLDRHGTLEAYTDAKLNIVRFQSPDGRVFVHQEEEDVARAARAAGAGQRLCRYAFEPGFRVFLRVPGRHNEANASAAIAVARALGVPDELIGQGLKTFTGLPHRLELVGEHDGVRYFNDSKSTTPESACIALEAFTQPVVMLIGGRDKGMSFDSLLARLARQAKGVVCYGETGQRLFNELTRLSEGLSGRAQVELASGLEEAVTRARRIATPGDVVVLSPACTSYDQFRNYEQRGQTFRELVSRFGR